MSDETRNQAPATESTRRLRLATVALEVLMVLGTIAGIQGFLSGSFAPLVDELGTRIPVDGPVIPAAALGLVIGGSQTAALILGLNNSPRAPRASLLAGTVLVLWVLAQLPLIGWTTPVQWVVFAVGVAEVTVSMVWIRHLS